MRVAVTGGSGLAGRSMVRRLAKHHDVVNIDILDPGSAGVDLSCADYLNTDILDLAGMTRALDGTGAVVHARGFGSDPSGGQRADSRGEPDVSKREFLAMAHHPALEARRVVALLEGLEPSRGVVPEITAAFREIQGTSGAKMGNAHLKWAFSEVAVRFVSRNPKAEKFFQRLVRKHGKGKALSVLASKLARAVYYVLKRERIFDMKKFLTA